MSKSCDQDVSKRTFASLTFTLSPNEITPEKMGAIRIVFQPRPLRRHVTAKSRSKLNK